MCSASSGAASALRAMGFCEEKGGKRVCFSPHGACALHLIIYMARKRKEFPILENVTITDVAAEGKALARVNDMVVFVPFAVPGDVVDLKIRKKKHSYCEAEVVRFVK